MSRVLTVVEPLFDTQFFESVSHQNFELGITRPKFEKTVLHNKDTKGYEGKFSFYCYVLQEEGNENGKINLFYNAKPKEIGWKGGVEHLSHLGVLQSDDGINFERPQLNNVKTCDDEKGSRKKEEREIEGWWNNVLVKGWRAENCPIMYDPNRMLGQDAKYVSIHRNLIGPGAGIGPRGSIGAGRKQVVEISTLQDILKWENNARLLFNMNDQSVLQGSRWKNYFDTLSAFIYNPYTKLYHYFTRYNKAPGKRHVQYTVSRDLKKWEAFREIDYLNHEWYNVYVPSFCLYPGSPYYIGFPPKLAKEDDYTSFYTSIMFSRDGVNWRNHPVLGEKGLLPDLRAHCFATGLAVVGEKFYIYTMYARHFQIECFSVPKDRMFYIENKIGENKKDLVLISKPLKLANEEIEVNYESLNGGKLKVEVDGEESEGLWVIRFTLEPGVKLYSFSYCKVFD